MTTELKLFIPLRKANAARREVSGVAAVEEIDHVNEIFDYASSKPHFEEWSGKYFQATGGKSYGNLRAQHAPHVAAGKLTSISFDDDGKSIAVVAKVVDDGVWSDVEQGVYVGFSIGGKYVKQWRDGALMRYTASPHEISLVDAPCMPSATFTMVKVDGARELRKAIGAAIYLGKDQWAIRAKLPPSALLRYRNTGDPQSIRDIAVWCGAVVKSHDPPQMLSKSLACTIDETANGTIDDALERAGDMRRAGFSVKRAMRPLDKAVRRLRKDSLAALHASEADKDRCPACGGYSFGLQPKEMQETHNAIVAQFRSAVRAEELQDAQLAALQWRRNAEVLAAFNDDRQVHLPGTVGRPVADIALLGPDPLIPATMSGGQRRRPGDYF
jgi:hypothetical protein